MPDHREYEIFPIPPEPLAGADKMGLGEMALTYLVTFAMLVIPAWLLEYLMSDRWPDAYREYIALPFNVTIFALPLIFSIALRKFEITKLLRKRAETARLEAENATSAALVALTGAKKYLDSLDGSLHETSEYLKQAESEFQDNAYDPFWDFVERAVRSLDNYYQSVRSLTENSARYHGLLKDRSHTFPPLGIAPQSIPRQDHCVKELQRIVRLGQTNFEFTLIWRQRKIEQVLVFGFGTLGDALLNIENVLTDSLDELREVLTVVSR